MLDRVRAMITTSRFFAHKKMDRKFNIGVCKYINVKNLNIIQHRVHDVKKSKYHNIIILNNMIIFFKVNQKATLLKQSK